MSDHIEALTQKDKPLFQIKVPEYLEETYWWAYVHPRAVNFFEKQWVINLILWGNFARLRDAALNALGESIPGRTLQVACVYGDFSSKLAERIDNGRLDIVDALPIQIDNVRKKIPKLLHVQALQGDSSKLKFEDGSFDQVVMFFLLHEMPSAVKEQTLYEALRVLKPGGKFVIVDYHKPSAFHPLRYVLSVVFRLLEPFALDFWHKSIEGWLPLDFKPSEINKRTFFGGLYQMVVIKK